MCARFSNSSATARWARVCRPARRRLARALARFAPLLYTGDLAQAERERVLERFRRDARHPAQHPALIVSLRAGGQGLNLQEASYVFHFDRWWNPAVEQQAEARAH